MDYSKIRLEKIDPSKFPTLADWLTPERINTPYFALFVRRLISRGTDEEIKESFGGITKEKVARFLEQGELCFMKQWGAPELVMAIALSNNGLNESLALRAVSMAQSTNELPEIFSPKTGVQWAMERGYLMSKNIRTWVGVPEVDWHTVWCSEWRKLGQTEAKEESAPHDTLAAREAVGRSITKQQVIDAFEGLHFHDRGGWRNALEDVPQWIEPCRVTPGRKGDNSTSATWNPVLIAAALIDKGIPLKKLDAVFIGLGKDWLDEWEEASASSRPTIPDTYRTPAREAA